MEINILSKSWYSLSHVQCELVPFFLTPFSGEASDDPVPVHRGADRADQRRQASGVPWGIAAHGVPLDEEVRQPQVELHA